MSSTATRALFTVVVPSVTSVHANINDCPSRTICGKPERLAVLVLAIVSIGPRSPDWLTRRIEIAPAPLSLLRSQLTMASPLSSSATSTRPIDRSRSRSSAFEKRSPLSRDQARRVRGASSAPVNQATTIDDALAAMAGPLTGQPSMTQLSSLTRSGVCQVPLTCLTI